jgi:predicted ATPase
MLDRIEVTNFKSIRSMQLDLRSLNVVIGPNGAGKSNLVAAFRLLGQIVQQRLQEYVLRQGGAAKVLHFGPKISSHLRMRFNFGRNGYSFTLVPTATDSLVFQHEQTHFQGDRTSAGGQVLGTGHQEAKLPEQAQSVPSGVPHYVMQAMRNWVVYHFHDTSDSSPPKLTQSVDDNRVLRPDAANLAGFLFRLQRQYPDEFRRITEYVQRVAPYFAEFRLAPLAVQPDKIKLEWRQRQSDDYFDGSSLSDGTLRFICLATLLLQPRHLMSSVILIDEPELGLHPAALTLLAEMMRNASGQPEVQILAATQSVTLLDQLTPDEVIVAEQADGASTFRRLDEQSLRSWLEDYSLGELWLKNVLGGRPQ